MKNPIKTYQFWIKIFAAALTIVLGLWILLDNTIAKVIVLMFTGLVTGIYALIRVVPLIKTLKTHRGRLISVFEIVIDLLLSVYLCYSAINLRENPTSDLAEFNNIYYRFFIAFILYLVCFSVEEKRLWIIKYMHVCVLIYFFNMVCSSLMIVFIQLVMTSLQSEVSSAKDP